MRWGATRSSTRLSRCTIVVASDHEHRGTWAGATEALKNGYGRVASWTGTGAGAGNGQLVRLGAADFHDLTGLGDLLEGRQAPPAAVQPVSDDGHQLSLDL